MSAAPDSMITMQAAVETARQAHVAAAQEILREIQPCSEIKK